jgi:hypothetical protein
MTRSVVTLKETSGLTRPPFPSADVRTYYRRPSGRFRRSVFLALVPSAAQSTLPLRPRQIRDSRHRDSLHATHRRRARHRLAFSLAPSLSAVRDSPDHASRATADGAAQCHCGGAQCARIGAHCLTLTYVRAYACARFERGVVRGC